MALEIEAKAPARSNYNLTDALIYFLSCSDIELGNFILLKLSEIRNLQRHLREVQETIFELGNQVELARLFRMRGSNDIRRILETPPPDPTIAARLQFDGRGFVRAKPANGKDCHPEKRIETRRRNIRRHISKTGSAPSVRHPSRSAAARIAKSTLLRTVIVRGGGSC